MCYKLCENNGLRLRETRLSFPPPLYFSPEFRVERERRKALFAIDLPSLISLAGALWLAEYGAHDARNPALSVREDPTLASRASER
jgi:hypothetical protein